MRYSEVAGPDEPDLAGPGMAIDLPMESADGDASWLFGAKKASVDEGTSARAAIMARVAFDIIFSSVFFPWKMLIAGWSSGEVGSTLTDD